MLGMKQQKVGPTAGFGFAAEPNGAASAAKSLVVESESSSKQLSIMNLALPIPHYSQYKFGNINRVS